MSTIKISLTETKKNTPKLPIKIGVGYQVIIMINDNNFYAGTHAGMIIASPTEFEIYDPNGSFEYPGIASGSSRIFPVYDPKDYKSIFMAYINYQLVDGGGVYIYPFKVSKDDFVEIQDNALNGVGCTFALDCSLCISGAISGIGIFKKLPRIFRPKQLGQELRKLVSPIQLR